MPEPLIRSTIQAVVITSVMGELTYKDKHRDHC